MKEFRNMKNNKIAFCLAGHYRTFDKCLPSLKNNILHNDVDIFCAMWDESKGHNLRIEEGANPETTAGFKQDYSLRKEDINLVKSISKDFKLYDYGLYKHDFFVRGQKLNDMRDNSYHRPTANLGMYFIRLKAFELMKSYILKTNTKYDLFCISRFDLLYQQKIDFDIFNKTSTVYIPKVESHTCYSDIMIIGDFNVIEKYSNLYHDLEEIIENQYMIGNMLAYDPHKFMEYVAVDNNFIVKPQDIDMMILRK